MVDKAVKTFRLFPLHTLAVSMALVLLLFILFLVKASSSGVEVNEKLNLDEIYVINLVRRPERHEYMKQVLETQGLSATFWPATDGKVLTPDGLDNLGIKPLPGYLDPYHKRPMTMGEIGCFLSHYFIWKHMIENTNHERILILEDDVRFTYNWMERFVDGMEELSWLRGTTTSDNESTDPNQPDLIYLGRKILHDNEIRSHHNFVTVKYSYWTLGYIITRRGVQKLLLNEPLSKMLPIDEFLPIMYDSHPNQEWSSHFRFRNLIAISFDPVLITPTHYIGDEGYISDTEQSMKISDSQEKSHPKYQKQNTQEL